MESQQRDEVYQALLIAKAILDYNGLLENLPQDSVDLVESLPPDMRERALLAEPEEQRQIMSEFLISRLPKDFKKVDALKRKSVEEEEKQVKKQERNIPEPMI